LKKLQEPNSKTKRILNRDGSLNIIRTFKRNVFSDLYHFLLSVSWMQFFLLIFVSYLFINVFFAIFYFSCSPLSLEGVNRNNELSRFLDCFFFSVQTLASIGYGRISPIGLDSNIIVTFEALVGLLSLGIITGLLFSRFSRPTAKITFSNVALVSNINGVKTLFFRVANERQNEIVEARVSCVIMKTLFTKDGYWHRKFYDLKLERNYLPIFALTWTIEHKITEESPLFSLSLDDLKEAEAEIVVSFTGVDEAFSQPISARFSYIADDILIDKYFEDILHRDENDKIKLELDKIHNVQNV